MSECPGALEGVSLCMIFLCFAFGFVFMDFVHVALRLHLDTAC